MDKIRILAWECEGHPRARVVRVDSIVDTYNLFREFLQDAEADGSELLVLHEMYEHEFAQLEKEGKELS